MTEDGTRAQAGWREVLASIREPRVLAMLALGFAAGLPFLLTGNTLGAWLRAPKVGEVQTVQATGDLTLAGVTKTVTVELQAVLNGETGQVAGAIPITFADYGVEAPNLGFVSVEPQGSVEFSLEIARG